MGSLDKNNKQLLSMSINVIFAEDAFVRLRLLRVYLAFLQGSPLQEEWKVIQDRISSLEIISQESALFYLIVGSLVTSALKDGNDRTQLEESFYFKALELSHKIYGDPRSCRLNNTINPEQIW